VDVIADQIKFAITSSAPGLPGKQFRGVVSVANHLSNDINDIWIRLHNEQSRAAALPIAELLIARR